MQDKSIYELFKNAFACKNEEIPYTKEQLKCEIITFKSEQYPEFGTVNAVIVYLENSDFSIGRLLAVSSENEEYKDLFVYSEESGKHFLRFRIDSTSYTKKIDMCPTQENIKGIFDFIINFINITEEQNGINLFEDENGNIKSKYAALLGKGDIPTMIMFGDCYQDYKDCPITPDYSKSLHYYKSAMEKGSGIGEWKYGWLLYQMALSKDEISKAKAHINNALNSGKITEKMQEYTENSYGIYWSKILNKNYFHWEKIRILKYSLSLTECHLSLMTPMDDTCGRFGITKDKLREMVRRLLYIQRREGRKRNN